MPVSICFINWDKTWCYAFMDLGEEIKWSKRDEKFGLKDYEWLLTRGDFGKGCEKMIFLAKMPLLNMFLKLAFLETKLVLY